MRVVRVHVEPQASAGSGNGPTAEAAPTVCLPPLAPRSLPSLRRFVTSMSKVLHCPLQQQAALHKVAGVVDAMDNQLDADWLGVVTPWVLGVLERLGEVSAGCSPLCTPAAVLACAQTSQALSIPGHCDHVHSFATWHWGRAWSSRVKSAPIVPLRL